MSSRRDRIFDLVRRFNIAADNAIANSRNENNVTLVDRLRMFQRRTDSAPSVQQRAQRTRVQRITLRLSVLRDPEDHILMPTRGTSIKKIVVPLSMNQSDFLALLTRTFPILGTQDIELYKVDRSRRITALNIMPITPASIKANTRSIRSAIYIRAKPATQQEPTVSSDLPSAEPNRVGVNEVNVTSDLPSAETNDALAEWRMLRRQQDEEYEHSLSIDRTREMRRRQVETLEADRRRVILKRKQFMNAVPEPQDGIIIQIKYPDGKLKRRRFLTSQSFQDLIAFAGCEDSASLVFSLQSALSSITLQSILTGSILDQGIDRACTFYVLWFSTEEVEAVLSSMMPKPPSLLSRSPSPRPMSPSLPSRSPYPLPLSPPSRSLSPLLRSLSPPPRIQSPLTRSPSPPPRSPSPPPRSPSPPPRSPPRLPPRLLSPPLRSPSPPPRSPSPPPRSQPRSLSPPPRSPPRSLSPPLRSPSPPPRSPAPRLPSPLPSPRTSVFYVPSSPSVDSVEMSEEVDILHLLQKLRSQCDFETTLTANMINVCRGDVINCAVRAFKRARFDPQKKISVIFMDDDGQGEGAVDEGGPTREFLRLLLLDIRRCSIFQGPDNKKNLSLDVNALNMGLYRVVGKMISVCLIHGGVSPHFFSERLFNWVSGNPTGPPTLSDVGDQDVEEKLQKIKMAETVSQAREAIIQASETLTVLGTMRYINSMDERDSLVQHSIQQYVEGRVLRGYQEFMDGLSTLGLAEAIQSYPAHFRLLFVENTQQLSAEDLINLFQPVLSNVGSSRRREESRVLCYWRDWLIDIEGEQSANVNLEDILIFASGLSRIPPLGFPVQPVLEFLHSTDNKVKPLPEANTCSIVLRLPIHKTYNDFKFWMESGIIQAPTFGVA